MSLPTFRLAATMLILAIQSSASAGLIAYYTFDNPADGGAASAGTAATLEANASITQNIADIAVCTGALAVSAPGTEVSNGAISGNSFTWATTDIRTVAFWMKAGAQTDLSPTMISLGSGTGAGSRFDVRLFGGALRLEVQSGASTISGTNLTDENWYLVGIRGAFQSGDCQ